jgi:hypothetical protein
MANKRVGGIVQLQINGEILSAKGAFTYNLGVDKRDAVIGSDKVHGFKEEPQVPKIEGAITDSDELDLKTLLQFRDGTVTLSCANGKVVVLREGWFAGEGDVSTEEGEIGVLFQGISAEEVV